MRHDIHRAEAARLHHTDNRERFSSAIVALVGLCTALPVLVAQSQEPALGRSKEVLTAERLDVALASTESPRETLGSFLSLKDGVEAHASRYLRDHRRADFDWMISARDVAEELLDLSAVPKAVREEVAVDTMVALLDVFDRVDTPPLEAVPSVEDFDESSATAGWRIPNTPLRLARVDAGERKGEFLFTTRTVLVAPRFSRQVRHLPSRSPVGIDSWSDTFANLAGPSIPLGLVERIPGPLKSRWLGTPIWKEILVVSLSAAALLLLLLWHRLVAGHSASSKVNAVVLRMLTPVALVLIIFVLEPFFANDINTAGKFAAAVEFTATASRTLAAIWLYWLAAELIVERIVQSPRIDDPSLDANFARLAGDILRVVGVVLIASWGLHELGAPALGVLTGLGIGSAALGLAVQPALTNVLAGLTLFREKAIQPGDLIRFDDYEGRVESIGVRSTHIRAQDQSLIWVPNANLVGTELINLGRNTEARVSTDASKPKAASDTAPTAARQEHEESAT